MGVVLLLAAGMAVALVRSAVSTVVVYNETGAPLPPLVIRVGGGTWTFPSMAEEESVRIRLGGPGPGGPLELELVKEPPWEWRGGHVEPTGGDRVAVRLYPDGVVEWDSQVSFWQGLIRGDSAASRIEGEPEAGPGAKADGEKPR